MHSRLSYLLLAAKLEVLEFDEYVSVANFNVEGVHISGADGRPILFAVKLEESVVTRALELLSFWIERDKATVVRTQNVKRADFVALAAKPDRPDRDVGIFRPAVLFVGDNRLLNGRSVFRERGQRAEIELWGFAGGGTSHNRIETAGEGGNSSGNNGCGAKTERGYGGAELATGLSHRFAWAYSCFYHGYCSDKLVKIRRLK